jgi:CPA1 family monovalent cation:H+ antiporter
MVAALRRDARRAATYKPHLEKMQARASDPELAHRFSAERLERLGHRIVRTLSDLDFLVAEGFGWRGGVVLAWSGMRGVVTVAAAQSLPEDTPFRPQVVLIAFVVAGTTLLAQGLTLPRVIRLLKLPGDDATADRAEYRELVTELSVKAAAILDDPDLAGPDGRPYPGAVLSRAREESLRQDGDQDGAAGQGTAASLDLRQQYRYLMLQILSAERAELLVARSVGRYSSRTLGRAQQALDLMEATLQQVPDLAGPEPSEA